MISVMALFLVIFWYLMSMYFSKVTTPSNPEETTIHHVLKKANTKSELDIGRIIKENERVKQVTCDIMARYQQSLKKIQELNAEIELRQIQTLSHLSHMKQCGNCTNMLSPQGKFCPRCGICLEEPK